MRMDIDPALIARAIQDNKREDWTGFGLIELARPHYEIRFGLQALADLVGTLLRLEDYLRYMDEQNAPYQATEELRTALIARKFNLEARLRDVLYVRTGRIYTPGERVMSASVWALTIGDPHSGALDEFVRWSEMETDDVIAGGTWESLERLRNESDVNRRLPDDLDIAEELERDLEFWREHVEEMFEWYA